MLQDSTTMISLVVLQNGTGCDEGGTCCCSEPCVTCAIEGCDELLEHRRSRKKNVVIGVIVVVVVVVLLVVVATLSQ
jgi:predicted nucleic acid-binding Zn ribbon protein